MGDFEFDNDLLISLVEARPVLWDKTDVIYKDRNETKKAWREVCVSLQEDFEALRDVQKNAFCEYCHNLLNTADCNSYKLMCFFYCMYSTVHIFDICQGTAPASVR
jgi:molybdenum cofactor biosynthesis enzyme MoaA